MDRVIFINNEGVLVVVVGEAVVAVIRIFGCGWVAKRSWDVLKIQKSCFLTFWLDVWFTLHSISYSYLPFNQKSKSQTNSRGE